MTGQNHEDEPLPTNREELEEFLAQRMTEQEANVWLMLAQDMEPEKVGSIAQQVLNKLKGRDDSFRKKDLNK